jgi:cell division transport system ATP-binding protein
VGLDGKGKRMPHELSGGEQQRVAIARAIVNKPQILLADEPTGNLDPVTSAGIMTLLERINASGATVVMATHEAGIVDEMQRRVIELSAGEVVRDERGAGYGAALGDVDAALTGVEVDQEVEVAGAGAVPAPEVAAAVADENAVLTSNGDAGAGAAAAGAAAAAVPAAARAAKKPARAPRKAAAKSTTAAKAADAGAADTAQAVDADTPAASGTPARAAKAGTAAAKAGATTDGKATPAKPRKAAPKVDRKVMEAKQPLYVEPEERDEVTDAAAEITAAATGTLPVTRGSEGIAAVEEDAAASELKPENVATEHLTLAERLGLRAPGGPREGDDQQEVGPTR